MRPIRIGNASGFYGDRYTAVREMLTGGPLDVLTGDYLAELTMLILGRDRLKDPSAGYAKTFLRQMKDNLQLALDKGVKIVSNAGGLNPSGLAAALAELGTGARIAYVTGDDLAERAAELGLGNPLTANAYLGAFGIAECLNADADIVVTGRVTDASLVVGPAIAHFGWSRTDYDQLAGATVAGHIIECGAQATGGNYSFFHEIPMGHLGFPIATIHADGSSEISKHPGTGGAVSLGTVTAQLLYEIDGPRYLGPDVTTRFDSITLTPTDSGVCVTNARGEPPPPTMKVCLNHLAGFRNDVTFVLTGLDIDAKASLARAQLESTVDPKLLTWTLSRTDHADAPGEAEASALLRVTAKAQDPHTVGRAFSSAAVELALASYPGFTLTAPPGEATPYAIYTAGYVPQLSHAAVLPDGTHIDIPPPAAHADASQLTADPGARVAAALGTLGQQPIGAAAAGESLSTDVQVAQPAAAGDSVAFQPTVDSRGSDAPALGGPGGKLVGAVPTGETSFTVEHSAQPAPAFQPTADSGGSNAAASDAFGRQPVGVAATGETSSVDEAAAAGANGAGGDLAGGTVGATTAIGRQALETPTLRVPLGRIAGARSGDKGGNANVGVWVRTEAAYRWLDEFLTVDRFRELMPEAERVVRYEFPNLLALNFVCIGLLGDGVAAGTRFDPQGKGLGEWLRSRHVDIPEGLL